jgi:spermidine synthase
MPHRQQARTGQAVQAEVASGVAELAADADRPRAWTLRVDGIPQSHVDLDDPEYLEFEYMRRLGHLADLAAPAGEPLRVLHLGGGALTLARYVAATRPGSGQLAVDSDAALVDLVRRLLPLDQPGRRTAAGAARIRIRVGDARAVLEEVRPASFDVVIADLFAGARTPAHVTTVEFAAAAAAALRPAGIFAANLGDGPPLTHARARVATVRAVFPHACLIADPAVLRGRRFGNLVLAASDAELPVAGLARRTAGDPFPGRVVEGADLDRFAAGAKPVSDAQAVPPPIPPPHLFEVRR